MIFYIFLLVNKSDVLDPNQQWTDILTSIVCIQSLIIIIFLCAIDLCYHPETIENMSHCCTGWQVPGRLPLLVFAAVSKQTNMTKVFTMKEHVTQYSFWTTAEESDISGFDTQIILVRRSVHCWFGSKYAICWQEGKYREYHQNDPLKTVHALVRFFTFSSLRHINTQLSICLCRYFRQLSASLYHYALHVL